jgi:uncharacterized repeat protein (TIGR03803 family)
VLYAFTGNDGAFPTGGVLVDAAGRLYGNAQQGGNYNVGVLYSLAPPPSGQTAWTEYVLHNFDTSDGEFPTTDLVFGSGNTLYGTAILGGKSGNGVVYSLKLVHGGTSGQFTVVHNFPGGAGGGNPFGGMTAGIDQGVVTLFGTTQQGGTGANPSGTVFSIDIPASTAAIQSGRR